MTLLAAFIRCCRGATGVLVAFAALASHAQVQERVVDISTRPGITQRMLVLHPAQPRAAVILLAGGHGGLQIFPNGSMQWGGGNFLVRTRAAFAGHGLLVAVLDAPSDRQRPPFLSGYRQTADHVADLRAAIGWLRQQAAVPVWVVGTSRGTQSAGHVAAELPLPDGPDGVVLTASILVDRNSRALPAMNVDNIKVPVLVVHHEQDACRATPASAVPELMRKLRSSPRTEAMLVTGGQSRGDPCEAFAHHGFNGIEADVVGRIAAWITAR